MGDTIFPVVKLNLWILWEKKVFPRTDQLCNLNTVPMPSETSLKDSRCVVTQCIKQRKAPQFPGQGLELHHLCALCTKLDVPHVEGMEETVDKLDMLISSVHNIIFR